MVEYHRDKTENCTIPLKGSNSVIRLPTSDLEKDRVLVFNNFYFDYLVYMYIDHLTHYTPNTQQNSGSKLICSIAGNTTARRNQYLEL